MKNKFELSDKVYMIHGSKPMKFYIVAILAHKGGYAYRLSPLKQVMSFFDASGISTANWKDEKLIFKSIDEMKKELFKDIK